MKFSDKPLTLEEMEAHYVESEYIGQIALIEDNGTKVLAILDYRDDDGMCAVSAASGRYLKEKDYGKTWWAFPYVGNEIDQEKWEPCEFCREHENPEEVSMLTTDEYESDRGMFIYNGILASNSGEFQMRRIDYCPVCGRPLTEEAWAELEKRIRG